MGYRCVNDLFSYCSDKPVWGKAPKTLGVGLYPAGGSCKSDPKTCGKHQNLKEHLENSRKQTKEPIKEVSDGS